MEIAVFSDSHDQVDHMQKALELAVHRGITTGIHLGDFCSLAILDLLATSPLTMYCVWGNMDGDTLRQDRQAYSYPSLTISEEDAREITIEGRNLYLTHYPDTARLAAHSGTYDAAFHGHTHLAQQEKIDKTLLANPGEIIGSRYGKPSFGIYSLDTNSFEHIWL